jgi:hypothetical protein
MTCAPELRVVDLSALAPAAHRKRRVDCNRRDRQHSILEQAVEQRAEARRERQQNDSEGANDAEACNEYDRGVGVCPSQQIAGREPLGEQQRMPPQHAISQVPAQPGA